MADPRFNSVHLEPPRRQEYRRAREALLQARGWQTVAAESPEALAADLQGPLTLRQEPDASDVATLNFWLLDRDAIYPLKVGLNTIGRSPENDVIVKDAYVSRRHCAILVHAGDGCELHDTASKNGTYLNGRKLAGPTRLSSGDEIRMCDRQYVFLTRTGEEAPAHALTQTE
jgi:pSer/pThr/pTyr-binding forkhead associated (FHA) protein